MDPTNPILIVGAGVFGLSTALHLARAGYSNIHIYDSQPYNENAYRCSAAASCDHNKVIRASYGESKLYQDLAFEAIEEWEVWNEMDGAGGPGTKLWDRCGLLRVGEGLLRDEEKTQETLPAKARKMQYRVSDAGDRRRAIANGVKGSKIDALGRLEKGLPTDGYFDDTAGFALASEACSFALDLCQRAGVKTHLGSDYGVKNLIREGNKVTGIVTFAGKPHRASLTIIACGGWTPTFLPETEDLIETTAGSIISFRLPPDRKDLWAKYAPENFPVWCWNMSAYDREKCKIAGIFGFPRTEGGVVKVCFTGAQWTNYCRRSESSGRLLSHPETGTERIPEEAVESLRTFCRENLPDLLDLGPEKFRLCWYSDSVDNSFLIDYVPGTEGLMVCSGGSGHGFKFLPVLGRHVVDVVERRETEYTRLWKWRDVPKAKKDVVEKGPSGWQGLEKQRMIDKSEWRRMQS